MDSNGDRKWQIILFQSFGSLKKARNDEASSSSTLAEATAGSGDCSFSHSDALVLMDIIVAIN